MKDIGLLMTLKLAEQARKDLKTVTRRLRGLGEINKDPDEWGEMITQGDGIWQVQHKVIGYRTIKNPYGVAGDRLYVKEAWGVAPCYNEVKPRCLVLTARQVSYKADTVVDSHHRNVIKWRSPLFMPKWAARDWYRRTSDRPPERLQEITPEQAITEGIEQGQAHGERAYYLYDTRLHYTPDPIESFQTLWDSINTKPGTRWEDNPWVWPAEFERIEHGKE